MGLSTTAIFSIFSGYFFGNFRDKANIIIQQHAVRRRFSVMPKCLTLNGYFALNVVFAPVWLAATVRHSKKLA